MAREEATRSDLVDIACEKRGETEKGIRLYDGTRDEWFPKYHVEFDGKTATMPKWLAKEKRFI